MESAETPETPNANVSPLLLQPSIHFNEIELKEKVGHGSYGVVYKAFWRDRFVAVKEFGASAEQKAIEIEVKQLSRVRHDNIIALFGISSHLQSKYLIMEFAEGGCLHNFLHGKVKPYYSTAHAMNWARQCAVGVAYLHAMTPKPLIHRDLKPLNLLLTNKGRHLKICDFGTVADKSTWMTNNKGSAAWMAPEVFEGSKYTEKCDIFSWAIVLWEVLTRQQPFKEIDNTYSIMWKIHKGERPPLIKDCPKVIEELMTSCWATVPDMRPSMQDVVDVMNRLAASFPGADEPLEYEFINQQIVRTDSDASDVDGEYTLDFSSLATSSLSSTTSTQLTPTNLGSQSNTSNSTTPTPTPTNTPVRSALFNQQTNGVPTAAITASTRWDVIPEETEQTLYGPEHDIAGNINFHLTPSAGTKEREASIRNSMTQMAYAPMPPLTVHVDPNAWDLNGNENGREYSKSDGKECLTVTDAKPLLPANSTIMSSNAVTNAMDETDQNFNDDEEDDNENVTDQSLAEMLGPELQPEKPIADNPESQQIYREHRRLGKDYLRVVTDLYYAQDFKEKTLAQMDPAKRQEKNELLKKIRERDELLELYNNLKQQVQKVRGSEIGAPCPSNANSALQPETNQQEVVSDDGWVVIAPNQNT